MILLTGITGNVGGATAAELTNQGVHFRALVRSPEKVKPAISQHNEIIEGDLGDADSVSRALTGVDRLLLVTPNNEQQVELENRVVDLAAAAGIQQIAKISSIEAGPDAVAPVAKMHYEVEQHIQRVIPHHAFLRPTFYMQTFFMFAQAVKGGGVLPLPVGDTNISMTDVRDLGKAAANILTANNMIEGVFPVTGTTPMSLPEIATVFSDVLGKPVKYADVPDAAYKEQLEQHLSSAWHVNAICVLFAEIKAGALNAEFPSIAALTRQATTPLEQFVKDHAMIFSDP